MDNNQKFISHFGVPGMRWGIRRAATRAGRALATSKLSKENSERVASEFDKRAALSTSASNKFAKEGKIARSIASKSYADVNKKRAQENRDTGSQLSKYYKRLGEAKKQKAYLLAEKYGGGTEMRKKIDALIKQSMKKPYDVADQFNSKDPIAESLSSAISSAFG